MIDYIVKDMKEMSEKEKLDEILMLLRGFAQIINGIMESPMMKMMGGNNARQPQ